MPTFSLPVLCPASDHVGEDKNVPVDVFLDTIPVWFKEKAYLNYVHFIFEHFRQPAVIKVARAEYMKYFGLFVTHEERRYKVTGASRFGVIYLATDLDRENGSGYDLSVPLNFAKLTQWSDRP